MKKLNYIIIAIIITGIILICGGCSDRDIAELKDCNLENIVKSVSNSKGTIWYDNQSKKYSVFTGIEGTYDSQDIGVACNLPDSFKIEGLKILFNGNYYKCEEFSPLFPGQAYYYLELTKIKCLLKE